MRPVPTPVLPFTHVENLPGIVAHGLLADLTVQRHGVLPIEAGHPGIKRPRRAREVDRPRGGVVADDVPFPLLSGPAGTSDCVTRSRVIEQAHGNLLQADVDALVNTVNTVGVMGKGIALQVAGLPGDVPGLRPRRDG